MAALETACHGSAPSKITAGIDALDAATKAFAGRRMNEAIAKAISGRKLDDLSKQVEKAKGVDAHVEDHARQT